MKHLSAQDVRDCIAIQAGESTVLEFKSESPDFSDKGKAEFLKDVSAMANADGGCILYGISEIDGKANELSGLRIQETDTLIRRITQIVH